MSYLMLSGVRSKSASNNGNSNSSSNNNNNNNNKSETSPAASPKVGEFKMNNDLA